MTRRPAACRPDSTVTAAARPSWDPAYGAVSPPLWTSDTFRWDDPEQKPGYDYSRTVSPNRDMLIEVLAELEGAAGGVVTGSGQSAALLALLLLPAGALVVAPHDCYGGTWRLISGMEAEGRLRARFVDMRDEQAFAAALAEEPALVWLETPSNPLLRLTDIARSAALARAAGALTLADNTLPTPCRQRPLALGCDLVLHSTTKALNGHGDVIGGALLASDPALIERLAWWSNAAGLNASAHDSWQTMRGLRTLPLRVDRAEANAIKIADYLAAHEKVAQVFYPGLPTHEDHALAQRQQSGPGTMLSFRLAAGPESVAPFLQRLTLITLASSLGGLSTLICQPSTMTHRGMPPEAQSAAGIAPTLLRLSIGIEDPQDLTDDLEAALG
ncbi:MAG TPA: PLP-dependent transferase [Allosphingosinicella sp.]|jgi:cystathionine gamma-synthase